MADSGGTSGDGQPHVSENAGVGKALQQGGFPARIRPGQQRQGLLVRFLSRASQAVGHGVRVHPKKQVPSFLEPNTVVDQGWHGASVGVRPSGKGQPRIGFDEAGHRTLAGRLEGPKLPGDGHQMAGRFRFQFRIEGGIDAVDGLPVHFRWPRTGKDVKRAPQRNGLQKRRQLLTGLLHRLLDHVAGGVSQFSLEGRTIGKSLEQFSTRQGHFRIVHGLFDLFVDLRFQRFHLAPQLIFDSSDLFNGRAVGQVAHRLWKRR